ncbi:unnamed protein product [Rhizophagus irregularis]|nr:unnamed protein product [Rhizophagus irregularis]
MIFWKHYGHYFELFLRLDGLTGHAVIGNAGQDEGLTSNEKGKRKGFFLMEYVPNISTCYFYFVKIPAKMAVGFEANGTSYFNFRF